jgi:hypothetical protein
VPVEKTNQNLLQVGKGVSLDNKGKGMVSNVHNINISVRKEVLSTITSHPVHFPLSKHLHYPTGYQLYTNNTLSIPDALQMHAYSEETPRPKIG